MVSLHDSTAVTKTEAVPGHCCGRPENATCWQNVDGGLGKWLNNVNRAQWAILVGAWETLGLRAMWTVEAQLKGF